MRSRSTGGPVEITLQLLKPYFSTPLTECAEQLGLSATAIKKACRRLGIPKWPFRTLTAKSSRNRAAVQAMTMRLSNTIVEYPSPPTYHKPADAFLLPPTHAPANRPVEVHEFTAVKSEYLDNMVPCVPLSVPIGADVFEEFSRPSSCVTTEMREDLAESADDFHRAASSPIEPVENAAEVKEEHGFFCPKICDPEANLYKLLADGNCESSPFEAYDCDLFGSNCM
eukprot:1970420-Rhodomonas_salina.1